MAILALKSGLWVRRLLMGGSPFQGRYPASEVNDGACPEKPVHLTLDANSSLFLGGLGEIGLVLQRDVGAVFMGAASLECR